MDAHNDPRMFARPLFKDMETGHLARVGVIDVGSNSVRLVVFDGAARSPAYFYNEKAMCGLGAGLSATGKLNPEGRVRALSALRRFQAIGNNINITSLTVVATAAVREADDGAEFCDQVERETGLKIWIIDGEEEARLSAQGVLLGWPGSYGLVCDMGGSSMELAEISKGEILGRISSPLGPLKLRDIPGGKRKRQEFIRTTMDTLRAQMGEQSNRLFLVGGSWRAFARIDMYRRNYPMKVLHEYRMTAADIRATRKFIEEADLDAIREQCGISAERIGLLPYASEVLKRLIKTFKPVDIAVSSYGIREGMLYEQMSPALRERDPLIEACFFAEEKDARVPGFASKLYQFVRPLFPSANQERLRLIHAACLLHDINWRAHPDSRAQVCFDSVTRANLGGLSHGSRVFLGLALLYRYRNHRDNPEFDNLRPLLSASMMKDAEVLGKAMRFGAMLWAGANDTIARLDWQPQKRTLHLSIPPSVEVLMGEVAHARLSSLVSSLGKTVKLKITTEAEK